MIEEKQQLNVHEKLITVRMIFRKADISENNCYPMTPRD